MSETRTSVARSFEALGGTAPQNYERYFVPVIGRPLAEALVDLADIQPGERVLDVACGTGIVARVAAPRIGPEGTVAGADINPGMVTVARSLPADVPIQWHEASADSLPFPDDTFNLVLCQLGLQFFPDRAAALREMHRVLLPSGRASVLVPGPAPEIFVVLEDALEANFTADAAAFVQVVFSLHEPEALRELMAEAGFRRIEVDTCAKTLRLPAPEEFLWQYVYSTPLLAAAAGLDESARTELTHHVLPSWQPFTQDGRLVLELGYTVASGAK